MPRVTSKGQVTIPKPIREAMGIEPGDEVTFVEIESGYKVTKKAPTTESGGDPFVKYRGSASSDGAMPKRMRQLRGEYPRETVDADVDTDGA